LVDFRLAAGLTQAELAKRARISIVSVSALERGTRRAPYRHTVGLLADALNLSAADGGRLMGAAARPHRSNGPREHRRGLAGDPRWTRQNLRLEMTPFVGRSAVLSELQTLLKRERVVTLVGSGGVGKTRTAVQVANLMCGEFPDGVWLVELASLSDGRRIADAVMAALGAIGQGTAEDALWAILREKRLLLVLDNCEHLLDATARMVLATARAAPAVRVLSTSRERLNIPGEQVFLLPALSVPPEAAALTAEEAMGYEAVDLFVARAQAADAHFALSNESASTIAGICRRLDGIALALELAAARVSALGLQQLHDLLNERFRLLIGDNRAVPARHRTLRASIDWSFDQLSELEQTLLLHLSVFAGSWTLDAAVTVCGDPERNCRWEVIDPLSTLVDKSLVIAEVGASARRYRLLESTREYALEKNAALEDGKRLAQRHASWCAQWGRRVELSREAMGEEPWLAAIDAEFGNVHAALKWCLDERNDPHTGADLAASLDRYWLLARTEDGRRWLSAALEWPGISRHPALAAKVALALAGCARPGRDRLVAAKAAVKRARALADEPLLGRALTRKGVALFEIGRLDESEQVLNEAMTLHQSSPQREGLAATLRSFGEIWRVRGEVDRARKCYSEALALYVSIGSVCVRAGILSNLAELEFSRGETERAIVLASQARETSARLNDQRTIGSTEANLAAYLIATNRWGAAAGHARAALRKLADGSPPLFRLAAIEHLAVIAGLGGDVTRAAKLFGYTDSRIHALGESRTPTEECGCRRLAAILLDRFESGELAERLAAGARMSETEAIAVALLDETTTASSRNPIELIGYTS
jgi:predicted ATPase/DNA-binding XRE family transcriptional regulator